MRTMTQSDSFSEFLFENKTTIFISGAFLLLGIYGFLMKPLLEGDGAYYALMQVALQKYWSPYITGDVARTASEIYKSSLPTPPLGMFYSDGAGMYLCWHFFAYPLFSTISATILEFLHLDVRYSFVVVNLIFALLAVAFVQSDKTLSKNMKVFTVFYFIATVVFPYFRWPHPEIFSASLLLIGILLAQRGELFRANLCFAGAALQNPSIVLIAIPFAVQHLIVERPAIVSFIYKMSPCLIALLPVWVSLWHGGVLNPIAAAGMADVRLMSFDKWMSFLFDLNQGLIVLAFGLYIIIGAEVLGRLIRFTQTRDWRILLDRSDIILVGFIFIAIPTLMQKNWNSGQFLYLRYNTWCIVPLIAWIGIQGTTTIKNSYLYLLAINFVFIAYLWVGIAGFTADRKFSSSLFSNVVYKPWVSLIWKYTNLYSPMPEIFVERSLGHEVDPVLDTYLPIRSREREDGFYYSWLLMKGTRLLLPHQCARVSNCWRSKEMWNGFMRLPRQLPSASLYILLAILIAGDGRR